MMVLVFSGYVATAQLFSTLCLSLTKGQHFFSLFAGEDCEFLMKISLESGGKERDQHLNVNYPASRRASCPVCNSPADVIDR